MKRKFTLTLALFLVMATVALCFIGCNSKNAGGVKKYLKDVSEVASTSVGKDVTEQLKNFTLTGQTIGNRSFSATKDGKYFIIFIGDDGTPSITEVGSVGDDTVTATFSPNSDIYCYYYEFNGVTAIYSANGGLLANTNDCVSDYNGDFAYIASKADGSVWKIEKNSYVTEKLVDADGENVDFYGIDVSFDTLADYKKAGNYYYALEDEGVILYDSKFQYVNNVVFPTVYDGDPHFVSVLANGNVMMQGIVRLPEEKKNYDLLQGVAKYDIVTMLYNAKRNSWKEVSGYTKTYLVSAQMVDEDSYYQKCDNVVAYQEIKDGKIDTSKSYIATLSNKGKLGTPWFKNENLDITYITLNGDKVYLYGTDILGEMHIKIYKGNKLRASITESKIQAYLPSYFYLDNKGVIRSFTDLEYSYDAKADGYEYVSDYVFKNATQYAIFNTDSKSMRDVAGIESTNDIARNNGLIRLTTDGDYIYYFNQKDGNSVYNIDLNGQQTLGCLIYNVGTGGAITSAYATFTLSK